MYVCRLYVPVADIAYMCTVIIAHSKCMSFLMSGQVGWPFSDIGAVSALVHLVRFSS